MSDPAVVAFTARGPATILREGGSQAWRLNVHRARKSKFLVCVQNRHNGDWGGASEPHGTAFLIGRITDVVRSPERPSRWLIRIENYARINIPSVWQAWRYPIRYMSLEELGIDPEMLQFEQIPEIANMTSISEGEVRPLTIVEAKRGLAAAFGVAIETIKITIEA